MSFFRNLRLRFTRPRLIDPDFGKIRFRYNPDVPERSYWRTCRWQFPPTRSEICIRLPGDKNGPTAEARRFYLSLPGRFEQIMAAVRPQLAEISKTHLKADLPADIFSALGLNEIELEDPKARPLCWSIEFESTAESICEKSTVITIPFIDDIPQKAILDTY